MRTSSRGGLPKTFGRKSQQWEAELQLLAAETTRLEAPKPPVAVTTEKILELAKQAENLYKLCYRTVRLIGEVFCLLTISHSTCSFEATKLGNGVVDGTRAR